MNQNALLTNNTFHALPMLSIELISCMHSHRYIQKNLVCGQENSYKELK